MLYEMECKIRNTAQSVWIKQHFPLTSHQSINQSINQGLPM